MADQNNLCNYKPSLIKFNNIFLVQFSNKSKRETKVTDLPGANRTAIDLIRELENEIFDFRFPYLVKTGEIERLYDKWNW
jgi:hypothetical protein